MFHVSQAGRLDHPGLRGPRVLLGNRLGSREGTQRPRRPHGPARPPPVRAGVAPTARPPRPVPREHGPSRPAKSPRWWAERRAGDRLQARQPAIRL